LLRVANERAATPGTRVVLSVDGSYRRDASAWIGCTLDGHLFVVKVWERPPDARKSGRCRAAWSTRRWPRRRKPGRFWSWRAARPGGTARSTSGTRYTTRWWLLLETNQPSQIAPACDRFRSAVLDGGLTHDGDATLARHVANCVVRESSSGTVITKPDPARKIDAAVAAVVLMSGRCGTPSRSRFRGWRPFRGEGRPTMEKVAISASCGGPRRARLPCFQVGRSDTLARPASLP
jgi:hypothetical protein